ncbi:MAG: hypothetical protein M3141_09035 [Actinomycetota bacterium]|nr:hypothetical protein [Actinomycetota bacterium]
METVLVLLAILAVLTATVWIVAAPLRGARRFHEAAQTEREALEAAKEAKYREIRDAEMDFRTGKLSEADYRALDRRLRAEAVEILHRIDEA